MFKSWRWGQSSKGKFLFQTSFIPDKEQYGETKVSLLATLDVAMGGRVAEEVIYGLDNVTTGKINGQKPPIMK